MRQINEYELMQRESGQSELKGGTESQRGERPSEEGWQGEGGAETDFMKTLDPPRTDSEACRDSLLQLLDGDVFQIIGIIVIILVVGDGALFFFLMVGWHNLCTPVLDCQPRNTTLNISIQILNLLFTYMNLVAFPWRVANFMHISGWSIPKRSNDISCNIYGIRNAPDLWFYIPLDRRMGIVILLLLNAITQFINQAARIKYYTYESSNSWPGELWVNIFFATSFASAGAAGAWMAYEAYLLRKEYPPGKFGPGPIESIKEAYREWFQQAREESKEPVEFRYIDYTRSKRMSSIFTADRGSLRMWGA
mmetsp:Transcript_17498/g.31408  ORF Transcript_17498/g.31408 Transcript_17498/m.31408 type:complete len:308 (-) Transcript_17498:293-1216(-)|eukprot:CAMPEP_0197530796 /NCGR_PEP_ID=MMETSP1318-20131121/32941_1 /TAXON_ID=552666 /ORGANISM="Partenskyella glossopodia, Strain RCC365" /LENGTH=307 /DNA_ID=CAMNT_0043086771 /DNA_START=264 /DNA_END=1187 /DNA_ORIENTATION=-